MDPDRIRRLLGGQPFETPELPGIRLPGPGRAARPPADLPPPPAPAVIAVASGKGGVGKSTIAVNIAAAFASDGLSTGLLDADVHSPDVPLMFGLKRSVAATSWTLSRAGGLDQTPLEPVTVHGIKLMSSGFIVAEDQAISWTADLVSVLLNQLIWSTRWGPLDCLIVDLPPGTSDIMQALFRVLPDAAAVLVVSPQDVAHLDNRRVLTALRDAHVEILGGVENMSGLRCPCCDSRLEVFAPVAPERSIWASGTRRLGVVPLSVYDAGGSGGSGGSGAGGAGVVPAEPVVLTAPGSAAGLALRAVADAVRDAFGGRSENAG